MTKTNSQRQMEFAKRKIVTKTIQLNKETDKDIIEFLKLQPNFQGTIKRLIRKEIAEIKASEEAYNNEYDEDGFWIGYSE